MLYCRTALTTPTTTPRTMAISVAGITICSVTSRRGQSLRPDGWPVVLVPKLPCRKSVSQVQYRSSSGSLRCSWSRAAAIVAGEMCGFAFRCGQRVAGQRDEQEDQEAGDEQESRSRPRSGGDEGAHGV